MTGKNSPDPTPHTQDSAAHLIDDITRGWEQCGRYCPPKTLGKSYLSKSTETADAPNQLVRYFGGHDLARTDHKLAEAIELYASDHNLGIEQISYSVGERAGHAIVLFVERTEHIKEDSDD